MPERDALLNKIAREQRGLFTLSQAEACGFARRTVTRRAERGIYEQLHPGVYGLAGSEPTWHREVMAAVLSANQPSAMTMTRDYEEYYPGSSPGQLDQH